MILLIDHYDSFVYNLARYLERLGQQTDVVRFDQVSRDQVDEAAVDAIVLSPGPCSPEEAVPSQQLVKNVMGKIPILGVCLGHQCIVAALGGRVVRAVEPMHGRTSEVFHDGAGVMEGLVSPLTACRYHSLVAERSSMPEELEVSAWLKDETVMAVRHRTLPLYGIQFHPESVLTPFGYPLLANFLSMSGLEVKHPVPAMEDECHVATRESTPLPDKPITF